jgi:hypothetical protein
MFVIHLLNQRFCRTYALQPGCAGRDPDQVDIANNSGWNEIQVLKSSRVSHRLDSSLKGFPIDPRVVQLDSDVGQALEHHAAG